MKNKQTFLTKGSFALLLFVILGYVVKFHPNYLKGFDRPIQTILRGDLPDSLTFFFSNVTSLINIPVIITWVVVLVGLFLYKKWWSEAILLAGNLALTGILVALLKNVYQRPRPTIQHLVEEGGFFSEWTCLGFDVSCWGVSDYCEPAREKSSSQTFAASVTHGIHSYNHDISRLSRSSLSNRCFRKSFLRFRDVAY